MSNDVLKVNDIAIGQNFTVDVACNGKECIILEDMGITQTFYNETPEELFETHLFKIEWQDGEICFQPKFNLRKKQVDGESLEEMLQRVKNIALVETC